MPLPDLSRPRTVVFLPIQEYGHILPTLKLATRLARDGWRVVYLASDAFAGLVEARSFERAPMLDERLEPLGDDGRPLPQPNMRTGKAVIDRYARAQEELYRKFCDSLAALRPDALLADFFYSDYAAAAESAGVTAAVYHICLDAESLSSPPLICRYGPPSNPFAAARMRFDWFRFWTFKRWARVAGYRWACSRTVAMRDAAKAGKVRPSVSSMSTFGAELDACVFGPMALSRGHLPPDRYFGYGLEDGRKALAAPFPAFERERPAVYFSLGSMSARYPAAYSVMRDTIAAFREAGKFNLIAQAGALREALAGEESGNVRVEGFAPQTAWLPRAAAVITHGGYGTIKESVAHGLPMLVVPFFQDQFGGASRVSELGIGETMDWRRYDARGAHAALERLLSDPKPRERLAQLYSPKEDAGEFERAYESLVARIARRGAATRAAAGGIASDA